MTGTPHETPNPAVQMRLQFRPADSGPMTVTCTLDRHMLLCIPDQPRDCDRLHGVLAAVGANPQSAPGGSLISVADISRLADLPDSVSLAASGPAVPFVRCAVAEPDSPAVLRRTAFGFELIWAADGIVDSEPLGADQLGVLAASDLEFVAAQDVAEDVTRAAVTARPAAVAHLNADRWIDIDAPQPHIVEQANLRGLFRVGPNQFGLPFMYRADIDATDAVRWRADGPAAPAPVGVWPGLPSELDGLRPDIAAVAHTSLVASGLLVEANTDIVRPLTLAAALSIDGTPIVVVAAASHLWLWWRLACDFSIDCTPAGGDISDVQLVAWEQLPTAALDAGCLIVDDTVGAAAARAAHTAALERVADGVDLVRLGVVDTVVSDPVLLHDALRLVCPSEFRAGVPVNLRYPDPADRRFHEHAAAHRINVVDGLLTPSARTHIQLCPQHPAVVEAFRSQQIPDSGVATWLLDAATVGPADMLGPKVAAVLHAVAATPPGGRITVVSASERFRRLTAAASGYDPRLQIVQPDVVDPADSDTVWFVDPQWDWAQLDTTAASAAHVTVLHTPGGVDDLAALWACRHAAGLVDAVSDHVLRDAARQICQR